MRVRLTGPLWAAIIIGALVFGLLLGSTPEASPKEATTSTTVLSTTTTREVITPRPTVPSTSSTTTTAPRPTTTSTSTTVAPTTTTTTPLLECAFAPKEVLAKLIELKYYDFRDTEEANPSRKVLCSNEAFANAVIAFKKVNSLPVNRDNPGEMTLEIAQAILLGTLPGPLSQGVEPDRIEISLTRQVLFLYNGGNLIRALHVSTGKAESPTPVGRFTIFPKVKDNVGPAVWPMYFRDQDGIAIHGYGDVPVDRAASGGCIRVSESDIKQIFNQVSLDMPVYVVA